MSFSKVARTLPSKGAHRLVMAFVAVAAVALVGTGGAVSALGGDKPSNANNVPVTKADCKNDGWKKYGFKNQGKCVAWVNASNHNPGYGGGNTNNGDVNVDLNLDVSGNNNVVTIILNFFSGL